MTQHAKTAQWDDVRRAVWEAERALGPDGARETVGCYCPCHTDPRVAALAHLTRLRCCDPTAVEC